MNNSFINKTLCLWLLFYCLFTQAQNKDDIYTYYIYTNGNNDGLQFASINNEAKYIGKNSELKTFFNSRKDVKEFYQAFPEIPDAKLQNIYVIKTSNSELCKQMLNKFPEYYSKAEDISKPVVPLDTYPNDYGTTSPIVNSGAPYDRYDLDYISAPSAWDITTGSSNIIIGISDTGVNNTLPDLAKTNYISGYGSSNAEHGSNVAALAAAQGDNGQGTVGVCYDCGILASSHQFGTTSNVTLSTIYKLASEGAQVINMSWHNGTGYGAEGHGYIQAEQDVINYCVNNFGTIFVAASGNVTSFSTPTLYHPDPGYDDGPFGILYVYPASYDNVISVSNVNAQNPELNSDSYCCSTPTVGALYHFIDDSVSTQVDGTDLNNPVGISGDNGYGLVYGRTLNYKVDILAPSYHQFEYWNWFFNSPDVSDDFYGSGTSYAAPIVSGTIGLMLSVNECLSGNEVEDILQLASKDIEHMPINADYFGIMGSGKLETGNAVHFVNEMKKLDGEAIIKDHIFYRFDFALDKFNNDLLIDNVSFIDRVKVDFKAKNSIELVEGTLLEPNQDGYIILDIDANIYDNCINIASKQVSNKLLNTNEVLATHNDLSIFPNPTTGTLNITNKEDLSFISISDITGKTVYSVKDINASKLQIDMTKFNSGMYFMTITMKSGEISSTKIIKK